MKKLILVTIAIFCLAFTLFKNGINQSNYKIYSSKTENEVTLNDIVTEMKNYDVVFFGEEHNDSVAHFLQMELFRGMYSAYDDKTILSMEMFETDCQGVLDEYLQGFIREKNFIKEARAWNNYTNYKPMLEFAKEKKLHVIAANAPARYVNMVSLKGQYALHELSSDSKSFLPPLPYDTATGAYYDKFIGLGSRRKNIHVASKAKANKRAVSEINNNTSKHVVHSQSLWDATMAYSLSKIFLKNPDAKVLQLNGRFHSDEGYGTVTQLKKYNPELRVLIISCMRGNKNFPNHINYDENKRLGNYVIYSDPDVPKTFK